MFTPIINTPASSSGFLKWADKNIKYLGDVFFDNRCVLSEQLQTHQTRFFFLQNAVPTTVESIFDLILQSNQWFIC